MLPLIAAGISAAGALAGSYLSSKSQAENIAQQQAASYAQQKEFAQNAIQWKVSDAQKAGIHPLYAMGAPTMSFAPSVVGGDTSIGKGLSQAGQDVSRALLAGQSADQRTASAVGALQLERAGLENELLRSQIARSNQQLVATKPLPGLDPLIPGQGDSGTVKAEPLKVAPAHSQGPFSEGGAISDVGWARTPTGIAPVPSKDVKERIEDNLIPETMWSFRNLFYPNVGGGPRPPFDAGAGRKWQWSGAKQEWQSVPAYRPTAEEYRRDLGRIFGRR